MRYRLAVVLRVLARAALRLSTRLSPPVPVSVAHPAARAALRRAAGEYARGGVIHPRPEDGSVPVRLDTGCTYTAGPIGDAAQQGILRRINDDTGRASTISREDFDRIATQETERWSGVLERLKPFDGPVRPAPAPYRQEKP